jgi:MYXO-CTERM domain-containing protein
MAADLARRPFITDNQETMGRSTLGAFGGMALVSAVILAQAGEARAQRVSFDAASSVAATSGNVSFMHTVGTAPDRYLVVAVTVVPSGTSVASASFGGQALARIGSRGSSSCRSELWGLPDPPSGARTVQVNLTASSALAVGASSYSGVDPRDPTGPFASHTGNGSSPQDLSTSAAIDAGDFTVDVLCGTSSSGAPTPSAGSGQTQRWRRSTATMTGVGSSQQNNSGGRATMSWTLTGSGNIDWSIATFVLNPSPAPPDAAPDVGPDVMPDLSQDLAADLAPDLAADLASPDLAEPDAAQDAALDAAADAGEADAAPDAEVTPAIAEYRLRVGCACRTGGPPSGGGLLLVVVVVAFHRGRRTGR